MPRSYPQEVAAFIAANVAGHSARELTEMINARFGTAYSEGCIKSYMP